MFRAVTCRAGSYSGEREQFVSIQTCLESRDHFEIVMPRLIVLGLCLCFSTLANAQSFHWESTSGPCSDAPSILAVNTNGDIIAGDDRVLYRSSDGGQSWLRILYPHYVGKIRKLVVLSGAKIVALTDRPMVVRMEYDGSNTKVVRNGDAASLTTDRQGNLFSVLGSTSLTRSTDGGDSWIDFAGPAGESVNSFSADERRYYVTTQSGIYTSADQGKIWRRALNGVQTGLYYSLQASQGGYVWATSSPGGTHILLYSTDYGAQWETISGGDFQVAILGSRNGEALMCVPGGSATFFHDSTLAPVTLPGAAMTFARDSSGRWLCTSGLNVFYAEADSLSHWHPTAPVALSSFPTVLQYFSGLMAGSQYTEYRRIGTDTWKDFQWQLSFPLATDYFDNSFLGMYGADLLRSTDSAHSWKKFGTVLPPYTVNVAIAPTNKIFAANRGVYLTKNAGGSWDETNDITLPGQVTAIVSDSAGLVYVVANNQMFVSSDDGASWQTVILPPPASITNLQTNRNGTLSICTAGTTLGRSSDHGLTWSTATLPDSVSIICEFLSQTDDIFAVSSGGVYYWPNGSNRLFDASVGLDSLPVTSICSDITGAIYLATNGAGVYKGVGDLSKLGVSSRASEPNTTVSPNPASSIVRIAVPSQSAWTATAYDELGRAIQLSGVMTGRIFECDVRGLPQGSFTIVLRANSERIVTRVQILR